MATYNPGTTATLLVQWYEFAGGPPTPVTAQTITIVRVSDAVTVLGPTGVGITNLAVGLYTFSWPIPGNTQLGDYAVVWNATDLQLDAVQTSELITVGAASQGPCDWDVTVTEDCCPGWNALPDAQKERATRLATKVIWAATGRRYGTCVQTIRPCGLDRMCGDCGSWYFYNGTMHPFILDGLWRNCACGCPCDCQPRCQVKLPGWVNTVTEVTVDGVIIAPSSWRVDDNTWLVRTDGNCWPNCQDYNVDSGAGTFTVTYSSGEPIPADVLDITAMLACEFAKSCGALTGACRLPGRLQTLSRQGVTTTMVDIDRMLAMGLTGIPEIDMIIMADNPYGHKQRPWLYSYDTAPRSRTVTQA